MNAVATMQESNPRPSKMYGRAIPRVAKAPGVDSGGSACTSISTCLDDCRNVFKPSVAASNLDSETEWVVLLEGEQDYEATAANTIPLPANCEKIPSEACGPTPAHGSPRTQDQATETPASLGAHRVPQSNELAGCAATTRGDFVCADLPYDRYSNHGKANSVSILASATPFSIIMIRLHFSQLTT